jgi:EpsI family protein
MAFAVGCALVAGVRPQRPTPLARPLATIPMQLAGMTGFERRIAEEEQRVAGMSQYVFRLFARADSTLAFTMYVGYYDSQVTGRTIHSPKNCLPGAGWEVILTERTAIDVGGTTREVNRALLANDGAQAVVYYWYQGRGRVAANEYRVKWDLLRDAALRGRTEEALVRLIVPVREGGALAGGWGPAQLEADSLARRAAAELIPAVEHVVPAWGSRAVPVATAVRAAVRAD